MHQGSKVWGRNGSVSEFAMVLMPLDSESYQN